MLDDVKKALAKIKSGGDAQLCEKTIPSGGLLTQLLSDVLGIDTLTLSDASLASAPAVGVSGRAGPISVLGWPLAGIPLDVRFAEKQNALEIRLSLGGAAGGLGFFDNFHPFKGLSDFFSLSIQRVACMMATGDARCRMEITAALLAGDLSLAVAINGFWGAPGWSLGLARADGAPPAQSSLSAALGLVGLKSSILPPDLEGLCSAVSFEGLDIDFDPDTGGMRHFFLSLQAAHAAAPPLVGTGFPRLEALDAKLEITGDKKDGAWNWAGVLDGTAKLFSSDFTLSCDLGGDAGNKITLSWAREAGLTLAQCCRGLGLGDLDLPDVLNPGLNSLDLEFQAKEKSVALKAASNTWRVGVFSAGAERRHYAAAFTLDDVALRLADLPVVGPAVDKLSKKDAPCGLYGLKISIASESLDSLNSLNSPTAGDAIPELEGVKPGVYLHSRFDWPGGTLPLEIPLDGIDGGPEQTPDKAESKPGGQGSGKPGSLRAKAGGLSVEKNIGPLSIRKIAPRLDNGTAWFALDAAFMRGALNFELDGLALGLRLDDKKPTASLDGLSLALDTGGFSLGGSFLKNGEDSFSGSLLMRCASFSANAVGEYTQKPCESVLVFAALKGSIGGPPCFFITGLAAAFGYNRALRLPQIEKVGEHALVKLADGRLDAGQIAKLDDFAPVEGDLWFAAGVMFNSFKMVDSFAVLTASVGKDAEIGLLGRSVLNIPFNAKKNDKPIAHAVLLLKASIRPSSGLAAVEAALAPDSYVLSPDCRLSGSFAFYTWFDGPHKGDFVLTLGGYAPHYVKPEHYPAARRLALEWSISEALQVKGELYFALTPSCVMAGGALKMLYSAGCVQAWFEAYMDIYIEWKPYRYAFAMGVRIGVRADLRLFTVSLELGCHLKIWGPEFSGIATVSLWCLSFDIAFGSGSRPVAQFISTQEFIASFLPAAASKAPDKADGKGAYGGCVIAVKRGLISEHEDENGVKIWIVCADQLEIVTSSVAPASSVLFNGEETTGGPAPALALRPCGLALEKAAHRVTLQRLDETGPGGRYARRTEEGRVPYALWAASDAPKTETVAACTGLSITAKKEPYRTLDYAIGFNARNRRVLAAVPVAPPASPLPGDAYAALSGIAGVKVSGARAELLLGCGLAVEDIRVDGLAADPEDFFCFRPRLAGIGG